MVYDETALEWYQRIQHTKRKLLENPIVFSLKQQPQKAANDNFGVVSTTTPAQQDDVSRFFVTTENMKNMAAATFFGESNLRNDIETRLHQWRRRQNRRSEGGHSSSRQHNLEELENELLASFPSGSGISFIDEALAHHIHDEKFQSSRVCSLEISGKTGTAKTQVLIAFAANYVAAISSMTTLNDTNSYHQGTNLPPIVVILDPEYNVHLPQLARAIRAALLRRFYATSNLRQLLYQEQHRQEVEMSINDNQNPDLVIFEDRHLPFQEMENYIIEREFTRALAQIQIVHPRDAANGYISTIEVLGKTLDRYHESFPRNASSSNSKLQSAPTMLLMDSAFSAFEPTAKLYESLPYSTGLSGRNEFIRQLKGLRSKHDIFLASTNCLRGGKTSSRANRLSTFNLFEPWKKIISHRLTLECVVKGSKEEKEGFQLIAVVNTKEGQNIIPFSVHEGILSFMSS